MQHPENVTQRVKDLMIESHEEVRNKAVAFAVNKIGRPYAVDFEAVVLGEFAVLGVRNHKSMVDMVQPSNPQMVGMDYKRC